MLLNCGAGEDPWESRGLQGDQSILKEISLEYSLEGLMLKLKLQYFGHLMWRTDTLEETLMLQKIEDGRRRGRQRMRSLTHGHEFQQAPGVGDGQGGLVCCSPWGCKELDTTERLNWTDASSRIPFSKPLYLPLQRHNSLAHFGQLHPQHPAWGWVQSHQSVSEWARDWWSECWGPDVGSVWCLGLPRKVWCTTLSFSRGALALPLVPIPQPTLQQLFVWREVLDISFPRI